MFPLRPKRVLVPTDFSDESIKVVEEWIDHVESPEHLTVLHVGAQAAPSEADLAIGWDLESCEARKTRLLEMLRKQFSDPKYAKVNFEVKFGTPASEIVKFAEEENVELIVLPSHGRTGLARLMIGSVAERVVRLAHCPVLVIRR
jgi:nucleotide-binding universal stress UspA family protein